MIGLQIVFTIFLIYLIIFLPWIMLYIWAEYKHKFDWNK